MPIVVRDLLALLNNAHLHLALGPAVIGLLYGRLGRLCGTLERLMARLQAGTLPHSGPRGLERVGAVRLTWPRAPRVWPAGLGWLEMMGYRAVGFGSQFQAILEQPEMAALLAAGPQVRRVLRPICRMLMARKLVITPARAVPEKVVEAPRKQVRRKREPIDWGRRTWPRGVLSAARRAGFKPVR